MKSKPNRSRPISIRSFFWKFFPPFEVRLTVDAITAFLDEHQFLCNPEVARDAVALARRADQTIYSIRIEGKKPDQLALILICTVVGNELSSGHHHVYRGVLGMIGQDMLKLWNNGIDALRDRGYYTDDQADGALAWIKEQIKNAG